jgi:hypothetical protein
MAARVVIEYVSDCAFTPSPIVRTTLTAVDRELDAVPRARTYCPLLIKDATDFHADALTVNALSSAI